MIKVRIRKPRRLFVFIFASLLLLVPASIVAAQDGGGDGPPPGTSSDGNVVTGTGSCTGSCGGDGGSTDVTLPNQDGNNGEDDDSGSDSGGGNNNPGSSSGNAGDDFTIDGEAWCSPGGAIDFENQGGWGTPSGGSNMCNWSCGGQSVTFLYDADTEDWRAFAVDPDPDGGSSWDNGQTDTSGNGHSWDEWGNAYNSGTAGTPTCGDWDTSNVSFSGRQRVEYICWAELSFNGDGNSGSSGVSLGGYNFTCGGNYNVTASSSVPCPSVVRDPYPRALVNTPNKFVLSSGGTSASSNSREWCEPGIRNYTISVGWDQLPITPIWDWNERSWSDQPGFGKGWIEFHTYDTSSFGLRENGPSKEGRLDLPAYQVSVTSYWQPWVADSWEQWHEFNWDCENVRDSAGVIIGQTGSECGERAACSGAAIGDTSCGEWKAHGSGKILIDLRWFGFPQFYVTRTSARDVTQPPPNIPAVNDELRQCNIPVPVIEVQSILTNP